jgi:hypothetical protein
MESKAWQPALTPALSRREREDPGKPSEIQNPKSQIQNPMTYFNDKKVGDPKWIAGDEHHDAALAECGVSVEAACRIAGRPVRWLVQNVIPHEAVTVIAGEPGAGKTFFACQLAADAARVSQCRVLLAASSCEAPELLRWRLDQAEADTRRIVLATLTPDGFNDRRGGPSEETIDERMAVLYHTLLGAGDPTSGILPVEAGKAKGKRQKAEEGSAFSAQVSADEQRRQASGVRPQEGYVEDEHPPRNPKSKIQNPKSDVPELPRAAELLVIDDVDGWFGKPGQCLSAAALARVIQRLNELARSLHVAIVVLVRAQMSAEGRLTSRQLSRLSQSASVVWMVVKDREQGTGQREERSPKSKVQSPKSEEGTEADDQCEMQIAKCKSQIDASGNRPDSEDLSPKTQDLRPKTSDSNPKSKIENPKSETLAYSQSDRRWLLPVKNNLAPDVATFGRAFELFDGQIRWHADDPAPSLAEATLPSMHHSDRRHVRQAAALWLEEALAAGPLPSKELYRQGVENGFSQGTLKRAATELGIHPHKSGFNGGWEMRWTSPPVVRGRGTTASCAGFKIFAGDSAGGDGEMERGGDGVMERGGDGVMERGGDGETERGGETRSGGVQPICPPSRASCASSAEGREMDGTSCASSAECGESCAASCASSDEEDLRPNTSGSNIYAAIADALREACFEKAG